MYVGDQIIRLTGVQLSRVEEEFRETVSSNNAARSGLNRHGKHSDRAHRELSIQEEY